MYRLSLIATIAALLVLPAVAAAQTTEPVGTVSTGADEVYRAYDNPNARFDATIGILAFGTIYDNETDAHRSVDSTAPIFVASITSGDGGRDLEVGDLAPVTMEPLGDESSASRLPVTMFGEFDGEYIILAVRQGTWVQVLVGYGFGDVDVLTDVQRLAKTVLSRWPSDTPVAVREDGLRTGGIWNMMPHPEDLDPDFAVDEQFEEGPPATSDTVVAAGTATATMVSPGVMPEATAAPERRLPLLPTPTPPGTVISEDNQGAPRTIATPAATATSGSRLAPPFDVTIGIIIADDHYTVADDGMCSGSGFLDALTAGEPLTLREATGGRQAITVTLDTPGAVGYDTGLQQDVCYFEATFTDVPARANYVLLAGDSVLGSLAYEELTGGGPVLVVVGDERP